VKMALDAMG
jgi:hypothetical protein